MSLSKRAQAAQPLEQLRRELDRRRARTQTHIPQRLRLQPQTGIAGLVRRQQLEGHALLRDGQEWIQRTLLALLLAVGLGEIGFLSLPQLLVGLFALCGQPRQIIRAIRGFTAEITAQNLSHRQQELSKEQRLRQAGFQARLWPQSIGGPAQEQAAIRLSREGGGV